MPFRIAELELTEVAAPLIVIGIPGSVVVDDVEVDVDVVDDDVVDDDVVDDDVVDDDVVDDVDVDEVDVDDDVVVVEVAGGAEVVKFWSPPVVVPEIFVAFTLK